MGIFRKTKSVKTLLDIFEQSEDAHSVVDLVERLQQEMNKSTVYRILDRLEDDGALHSFVDKDGRSWYAKCKYCSSTNHRDTHPHFQCTSCGKIECLPLDVTIPAVPNYRIKSAELLLVGLCKDCIS
jgi:Fur family transcriptional regulator, ferric uptake regulator